MTLSILAVERQHLIRVSLGHRRVKGVRWAVPLVEHGLSYVLSRYLGNNNCLSLCLCRQFLRLFIKNLTRSVCLSPQKATAPHVPLRGHPRAIFSTVWQA